jgi:hypothetical protein
MRAAAFVLALLTAAPAAAGATHQEREDYYYPPVRSSEIFDRTLQPAEAADRAARLAFVREITMRQFSASTPKRYALFAKGEGAHEMIITALDDDVFATLFRARAVIAQLAAPAHQTTFFETNPIAEVATFYDMMKRLGFDSLTLTDGRSWSHRIQFR